MVGWSMFARVPVLVALVVAPVAPGTHPALGPGQGAATDAAYDAIDAHVRATMEAWAVPGVAFGIVRDGSIDHLAAFGTASPDGRPMTVATPIVVGSVGKSITALAIRQLVEAGRLELAAPVTRYLPWFRLAGATSDTTAVTIGSLLGHTSGLSTADGQDPRWYEAGLTPERIVRDLAGVRVDRPAGTYEYSNLNYVILGVVVEAISGQSYGDYLRDHVFGPLGMRHTYTSVDAAAAAMATGHRYLFGLPVPFAETYPTGMLAAGFHISSAEDMARYVAALANGGVAGGIDIVGAGDAGASRAYGTDWEPIRGAGPGLAPGQSGSTLTTNADIIEVPSERLGVVVLMNANPTQLMNLPAGAAQLALDVLRLARGESVGSAAMGVRTVYLALDAALVVLLVLLAIHLARARSWRGRLALTRHRTTFVARTALADGVLPAIVLLGAPLAVGLTGSSAPGDVIGGWRFIAWTLPDVACAILALAIVPLGIGAWKGAGQFRLRGATTV